LNKSCISKLILPGSLISVRIGNDLTWSNNIVLDCSDEGIDIPLTADLMKSCILVDTCIIIKFKNEFFEYLIHGPISKIELCGSPFIKVHSLDIFENINNRVFPRHDVYLPATISIGSDDTYFCKVLNISLGGIAFLLDKEIPNFTDCEVNIFLNDKNTIFSKGIILRCFPQAEMLKYSMQFTFMNEEDSNCLYSFLYSIDNSYNELRNKYI